MHDAFRQCLMDLDIAGMRKLARATLPYLPQPGTDTEALTTMHMARTQMQTIPPRQRYSSHRWLTERGMPSQLPDRLRPSAERMYPKKVLGVAFAPAGNAGPEACGMITEAVEYAVNDCFANGDTATAIVKPQMMRARLRERKALMLPMPRDMPAEWRP